jgi:hypothetical protein
VDGDRLALSVTGVDGRTVRWGGDDPGAEMIPADLEFGTAMPGGHKDLSCSLLRRLGGDERLFDRVRVYGPGNRTAWDGRLVQFPREDLQLNPGAVGWSSHLRDDPSFREIYVDQDKGHWGPLSAGYQIALSPTFNASYSARMLADESTGQPALQATFNGAWTTYFPMSGASYSGGNIPLGSIYYAWKRAGLTGTAAPWTWSVHMGTTDTLAVLDSTANLAAAGPGTGTLTATASNRLFAVALFYYNAGATGSTGTEWSLNWTCLGVYGTHGLTKQGTASATEAQGFYGHDLVYNIVSRTAPLLTTAQGVGGVERNTSFVVPQAAFLEPTTGEQALMSVNGYFLWEWGVYDDKRFFWRASDPDRLVWRARADRGAHVSLEGETAEAQFNGVLVNYTDPSGQKRIAGPPAAYWQGGVARCNVTNAVLVDTTSTNSVNRAGIPRRWGVLDLGPVTTDTGAVQIGYVWLAEHSLPQRRGTITVQGAVEHPTEGMVPPWRIRAGDGIVVTDLADDQPRRIIETRYSRGSDTLTATVGNPDYKLDAILERIGVQLTGVAG